METGSLLLEEIIFFRLYLSDDRGSYPGGGWEFFLSTQRPDRLWVPISHLFNGYRGLFPWK